jgi:hypothetical protein
VRRAWLAIVVAACGGTAPGHGPDAGAPAVDATTARPDASPDAAPVETIVHRCVHTIGGPLDDDALAVAADGDGSTVVAGRFRGTAVFAGAALQTALGDADGFVARFAPDCSLVWVTPAGGAGADVAFTQLAVGARGAIFVAGSLDGAASFGATTLDATGGLVVASLDDDTGAFRQAIVVGTAAPGGLAALDDAVYVAGVTGASAGFVARLDASLSQAWSIDLPLAPAALAADGDGFALAGAFAGTITLGAGRRTTTLVSDFRADCGGVCSDPADRSLDPIALRVGGDGALVWARAAHGGGVDVADAVAVDLDGDVAVGGSFGGVTTGAPGTLRFGGVPGTLGTTGSDADVDAFVASWTHDGDFRFALSSGTDAADAADAVAYALDGTLVVAGAEGPDGFATALAPDGTALWNESGTQLAARAIDVFADGTASVAGSIAGDGAWDGIDLTSAGDRDAFWLTIGPPAAPLRVPPIACLRAEGGPDIDQALAVAADSDGSFLVFGSSLGASALGFGEPGEVDLDDSEFLARFRADCSLAWAVPMQARGQAWGEASLTVGPEGITLARPFAGTASVGGTTFGSSGPGDDGLLARFDADGGLVWVRHLVASAPVTHLAHAISGGQIYAAITYGDAAALVGLDGTGQLLWTDASSGSGALDWARVAPAPDGGAYFTASALGHVTIGGQPLGGDCVPDGCVVIARFGATGAPSWIEHTSGQGSPIARAIAASSTGRLLLGGQISPDGGVSRACVAFGALPPVCAGPYADAFLAAYGPDGGAQLAVAAATGDAWEGVQSIAATPDGGAIVAGVFGGPFGDPGAVGATELENLGGYDVFIARFDATGAAVWARPAGGPTSYDGASVALSPDGSVVAAGRFAGAAVFDLGEPDVLELRSDGPYDDAFVARYAP